MRASTFCLMLQTTLCSVCVITFKTQPSMFRFSSSRECGLFLYVYSCKYPHKKKVGMWEMRWSRRAQSALLRTCRVDALFQSHCWDCVRSRDLCLPLLSFCTVIPTYSSTISSSPHWFLSGPMYQTAGCATFRYPVLVRGFFYSYFTVGKLDALTYTISGWQTHEVPPFLTKGSRLILQNLLSSTVQW